MIVHIRDMTDCIIVFNLSSIVVQLDLTETFHLMNNLTDRNKNPLVRLLSSRNPNIVGQVLNSVSQQLNRMNNQTIEEAISSNYSIKYSQKSILLIIRWNSIDKYFNIIITK